MTFSLVLADEPHVQGVHCCAAMTEQVNLRSPLASTALLGTTDKRIYWSPVFNEYGLINQPSAEVLVISHCPFCGFALPPSHRQAWFEALERTGWRTWGDPIPPDMLSPDWLASNPSFKLTPGGAA
jgi:hypothetical protein